MQGVVHYYDANMSPIVVTFTTPLPVSAVISGGVIVVSGIVQSLGSASLLATQVLVGLAVTQIAAARATRNAITIEQLGTNPVYVGAAGVSAADGFLLPGIIGANITIPTTGAVFGIATGVAQLVSVLETF